MAKCKNCGAELRPGAKFCRNCGTPVDEETLTPGSNTTLNVTTTSESTATQTSTVATDTIQSTDEKQSMTPSVKVSASQERSQFDGGTISIHDKVIRVNDLVIAVPYIDWINAYIPQKPFPTKVWIPIAIGAFLLYYAPYPNLKFLGIILLAISAAVIYKWWKDNKEAPKVIEINLNCDGYVRLSYSNRDFANQVIAAIEDAMADKPVDFSIELPVGAKVTHMEGSKQRLGRRM